MDKPFDDILKNFRLKYQLTQAGISSILGISTRMYQLYEAGSFTGSTDKKNKYLKLLREYEISKGEGKHENKHESTSFISEPRAAYEAKKPPGEDIQVLLDKIKLLEQSLRDKDDIIRLMKEKEKRAEALETLFLSALSSRKTMKEFHDLIENAVASKS